jgi:NADH-quinone oxidoreductase subunit I
MVAPPHEQMISDDHHDYYRGKSLPIVETTSGPEATA